MSAKSRILSVSAAILLGACGATEPLDIGESSIGGKTIGATGGNTTSGGTSGGSGLAPVPQLVTLAQGVLTPYTIALDSTSVYWTNYSTDGTYRGSVMKVSLAGGSPVTLATGMEAAAGIAVDDSGVYFAGLAKGDQGSSLFKVGFDGGTVTRLASGFMDDPFALGPTGVYGTGANGAGLTIVEVPRDGGTPIPVVPASTLTQTASSYGVALDATSVYWTFFGSPTTVRKAPLGGGSPITLATVPGPGYGIAVDAAYVYFGTAAAVMKVALDGGTPTTLAKSPGQGVAIDDDSVYFTDWSSTVKKVSKNGGTVLTLATDQLRPWSIAVDAASVYWGNCGSDGKSDGSVMKLTPK